MDSTSSNGKHFTQQTKQPSLALRACSALSLVCFLLGALLLSLELWLADTWAELSPDEIIFHLKASLGGTDTTVIWSYVLHYVPFVALACLIAFFALRYLRNRPRAFKIGILVTFIAAVLMGGWSLWGFYNMIGLDAFFLDDDGEDFIGEQYVDPASANIQFPQRKRNLIYIFLESMELTYADKSNGGAWDTNLIPELTELAHEGECFAGESEVLNGGLVMPGCTFTTGAMFGQSSGVPLKLPFYPGKMNSTLESFFPDLTLLGDILDNQGYHQRLLIGSDATFGDRREFYTVHGNFEIWDYPQAQQTDFIPEDYHEFWGYEDEKLFERARNSLLELSATGKPFNLTMLTVDTHFEDGYTCHLCRDEHDGNQYANVMSCSSRQVTEFVRWVQSQDFYDNTTIVISGDHTTMDKDFCNDVDDDYQRKTFTAIINGAVTNKMHEARTYTTLDLFPTTLAAMGCTIEGERLGIGTNLYAGKPTLAEEYGTKELEKKLSRKSEFLDSYSNATISDEFIEGVVAKTSIHYYRDKNHSEADTGFMLEGITDLSIETIESAHMVLTDTRTGVSQDYPMVAWNPNPENPSYYYLLARAVVPYKDRRYYKAEAYIKLFDKDERLYCSWAGSLATKE